VFYVYLLQSEEKPDERYVGFTTDPKARLKNS
jgi:predicted GIY-YIG superfamily endonuclease